MALSCKPFQIGQLFGGILCVAGWGLAISAHRAQKGAGNNIPFKLSAQTDILCTNGPYKFSRNPMVLGVIVGVCTATLLLPYKNPLYFKLELLMVSIAMTSCALYSNYYVFPHEERHLEQKHGEQYLEYKRNVNRWYGRM